MSQRTLANNGIEIWSQDFGDPSKPAVLLIMGATAQAIIWPEPLIEKLVATGKHVLRYDHRDVGQSTCSDFDANPYTLDDLAEDAVAVLDGWNIKRAHVIGVSMGGMITQLLMTNVPDRLITATLISTSPLAGMLYSEDLPLGPFLKAMNEAGPIAPPKTKQDWLARQMDFFAALADPAALDKAQLQRTLNEVYDRAGDIETAINHARAISRSTPVDRRPMLAACTTPTTVLHGGRDPIFSLAHGQAIADTVPGANISVFDRMAHDLPEYCWVAIVESVSTS